VHSYSPIHLIDDGTQVSLDRMVAHTHVLQYHMLAATVISSAPHATLHISGHRHQNGAHQAPCKSHAIARFRSHYKSAHVSQHRLGDSAIWTHSCHCVLGPIAGGADAADQRPQPILPLSRTPANFASQTSVNAMTIMSATIQSLLKWILSLVIK
jgi:hypothetical protein